MSQHTKTPAMILREFAVKQNFLPPDYLLITSKNRTHENEFHYQVIVGNVCTVGIGRSKKLARHDAASKALEIFTEQGLFNAQSYINGCYLYNFIDILRNICCKLKLPCPIFSEISDVGGQFTYECKVASETTQSTAQKKKHAKQLAAGDMIDKIKGVDSKSITSVKRENHKRVATSLKRVMTTDEFYSTVREKMMERNIKFEDNVYFQNRSKEGLDEIFTAIGVTYEMVTCEESPPIVYAVFDLGLSYRETASGSCPKNAELNLINQIYTFLDIYMYSGADP